MEIENFRRMVAEGIPDYLPELKPYDNSINHAPRRKDILSRSEKVLAIKNALRYFPEKFHETLAKEFANELNTFGRIYMYRYMPHYEIRARHIDDYPYRSRNAAAIMLMISNNLDEAVAQHPHELITYGGNGAVFQNWAQYRLVMKYLSEMTDEQTLVVYSGHPLGLFPSHKDAPRVVVTNGMVIPNYSSQDHWEKFNALGVSQYGQMTAGSYMYIGPQGIVHGTTITLLNACRIVGNKTGKPLLFVSSGLGGMSGAQPKAAKIAGMISVIAEVNEKVIEKRYSQGWVDEVYNNLNEVVSGLKAARVSGKVVSMAYHGNIVDLWKKLSDEKILVDIGSDQTSLHNPWAGGYYPAGISFDESVKLIKENPVKFRELVQESLRQHVVQVNRHASEGTYFFDYGNAFLLESSRAGAEIMKPDGSFRYPSYVEDIMGPLCFDYGFGPFRWVCCSGSSGDLRKTDKIAYEVLTGLLKDADERIRQQMKDNIHWIKNAERNNLVVGSQARILYADAVGRTAIAEAFNSAVALGEISAPVVIGRDHHDVSGTDSPFRETSNIRDGSSFTADMAVQNVIGDAFRGATWVSLHNGGGVGWGEVINGGFGMVLDGKPETSLRLKSMLNWDVNNGIARRSWARNDGAIFSAKMEMERTQDLKITMPYIADNKLIEKFLAD
ncbi:MAG TPA: urocanate hydratase [Bacteroidales bacterium]|nr:urocanate hydratase [Bacteroidales bacterium]